MPQDRNRRSDRNHDDGYREEFSHDVSLVAGFPPDLVTWRASQSPGPSLESKPRPAQC
jgi:hypothetical protein